MGILKGFILLAVMMLSAGLSNGYAQNTYANPYINSWHRYRVAMDDPNHIIRWDITGEVTVNNLLNGAQYSGEEWVRRGTQVEGLVTYAYIDLKFVDGLFAIPGADAITLIFSEWDSNVSTAVCYARRSTEIVIQENTFYMELGGDMSLCNPLDGDVLNWNDIDTEPMGTGVPFRITMNKAAGFAANTWTFSGSLTSLTGGYTVTSATSSEADGSDGTGTTGDGYPYTIAFGAGTFTVTVTGSSTVAGVGESDYVDIQIWISGRVWVETVATLTVTGGQATSGSSYSVITDDNGSGDRVQTYTLWALPGTYNIVSSE